MLRVFGCPAYYHVKEKLDPRAKKVVFVGFKKGVKGYKIWDAEDKKFILSRDVTFDEALMVKPINSQHVKSEKTKAISQQVEIEKTKRVSQQMESDATSPSLEKSVSLEIISTVTQGSDYVPEQDADEDQRQVMGDVQEFIAVERARRNPCKPS